MSICDFNNNEFVVLGARPGMGKSTLSLKMIINAIKENKKVALFNLECGRNTIIENLNKINNELDYRSNLYIDDTANEKMINIINKSRDYVNKVVEFIVIDYLQLIDGDSKETLKLLKELTTELNITILVITQLSKNGSEIENIKASISVEDKFLFMNSINELTVFKNNHNEIVVSNYNND